MAGLICLHFTGSGGNDVYKDISGTLEVETSIVSVPEPDIAVLLCPGLAGLGFMRRFKR